MRSLVPRGIVVLSLTGVSVAAQGDQPSLSDVLKAAGEYVASFERNASLVAEEDYCQFVENNRRTLRSEMLVIPDDALAGSSSGTSLPLTVSLSGIGRNVYSRFSRSRIPIG